MRRRATRRRARRCRDSAARRRTSPSTGAVRRRTRRASSMATVRCMKYATSAMTFVPCVTTMPSTAIVGRELLKAACDLHPVRHRGTVLAFGLPQILGRHVRDQRELGQGSDPIFGLEPRCAVVRDVEPLFRGSRNRAAERDQAHVRQIRRRRLEAGRQPIRNLLGADAAPPMPRAEHRARGAAGESGRTKRSDEQSFFSLSRRTAGDVCVCRPRRRATGAPYPGLENRRLVNS